MQDLPLATLFRFLVPAAVIVAGLVLSVLIEPIMAWAIVAACMLGIILVPNPRLLFLAYVFWSLFAGILTDPVITIPGNFGMTRYVDELIAAAFTLCLVGQMTMIRRLRADLRPFVTCFLLLLAIMALSIYVNQVNKLVAFKFLSTYLGFVPPFLVMLAYLPRPRPTRITALLVILLAVQLALNFTWYFGANPIGNRDLGGPDFAHGTLGGCSYVAYFCVFLLLLAMARLLEPRRVPGLGQGLALFIAAAAFVQLLFTFTMHAILLLGFCAFLYLVLGVRLRFVAAGKLAALMGIGAGVLLLGYLLVAVADVEYVLRAYLNPETIKARLMMMRYGPTMTIYHNVFIDIWNEVPVPLLGAGPGAFGSSVALEYGAPLTRKFLWVYYMTVSGRQMIQGSSITQSVISGISAIWGDLGPIGALLFFGLYVIPVRRVWRHLKAQRYADPYQRLMARVFMPFMAMILFVTLLQDNFWNDLLQCSVFVLGAYLWDPAQAPGVPAAGATAPPGSGPPRPLSPVRPPPRRMLHPNITSR